MPTFFIYSQLRKVHAPQIQYHAFCVAVHAFCVAGLSDLQKTNNSATTALVAFAALNFRSFIRVSFVMKARKYPNRVFIFVDNEMQRMWKPLNF